MSEVRTPVDCRATDEHMIAYITTDAAIKRVMEEFMACVVDHASWIGSEGVTGPNTKSGALIALAEINGARAMAQRVLDYLYEMS